MNDEKTRLDYSLTPAEIFYTRDSRNPSVAILNISASNTQDEEMVINRFQVSLPTSPNPDDKDAITADASSIIPVSLQAAKWDFSQIEPGLYEAKPIAPVKGVPAGTSINFQLKNIIVNNAQGTVIVTIVEVDPGGDTPTITRKVAKIKSDLDIKSFDAVPTNITSGDPSTLSWTTIGAAKVTLAPGEFPDIKVNDSVVVHPLLTTVFTLTAIGEGPNISKQVTVQIAPPKIVTFKAEPKEINAGDIVKLSWEVEHANDVFIIPGDHKNLPLAGNLETPVQADTIFNIYATNLGHQSASLGAGVTVKPVKIKSFYARPGYALQAGDAVELGWELESATGAFIQPISYNIPDNKLKGGTYLTTPSAATSYSLTAQNSKGIVVQSIDVLPMPPGWYNFSSNAPFNSPTLGVLKHDVKMWLFTQAGRTYNSWDGQNWTTVTGTAEWKQRSDCAVCAFNGKMWLLGGEKQGNCLNDVWSSTDGSDWKQVTQTAQWPARKEFGSYTIPGSNKIFIVGGKEKSGNLLNDVWSSSDGITWVQESNNAFATGGRSGAAIAGAEQATYALGGTTSGGIVNETYITTDGKTWNKLGTRTWPARTGAKACITSMGIFFGYGKGNSGNLSDFFLLNGTGCFLHPITPQATNSAPLLLEYQDAVWFLGGPQGGTSDQSVWSFNPEKNSSSNNDKEITIDFDMGSEGGTIYFMIKCTNIPVNSKVGFYADRLGTNPTICLLDIPVTTYPSFTAGIQCNVPSNFRCNITAYATAPAGVPFPPGSSIAIQAFYTISPT